MAIASRTKPPAKYKKPAGKHHRHSKHYMKAYWPYIPIGAIVSLGVLVNSLLASPAAVLGANASLSSQDLLTNTNQERVAANESPLTLNDQLTAAAQSKADDMVARDYWSHDTPDGRQPWSFVTSSGYNYQAAGENLAYGFNSAGDVINGWMASSEHRANILNGSYSDVGFGVASSPNFRHHGPEIVVVSLYGEPVSARAATLRFQVKRTDPAQNVLGVSIENSQPVSRVQTLTGTTSMWFYGCILASLLTIALFLYRHGRFWHKALARSELFVIHHLWFDIMLVSIGTAGIILLRVVGVTA